jgi:UDP-3-O-[3-hydroxymyristoyl] glucosamine N-acyltransferase
VIGDNVTIFAGTKIYEQTIIGNNCAIHSGSVIGADGFGFAQILMDFKKSLK